ncbi:hypothetical protein HORIV_21040 [Vreelandella olivaria]|uniref:Cadherin domain-containing protein n=1 Tax=Vreelandella olivaria TaxID=390919 RepID=A0ABN5WSR8_9GAMM|nr:hypothetical protein HORIV_21040 [Halomonas olivaria]
MAVTNVNEGPTLGASAKVGVPENTTGTVYTATASDPENAHLFYTLSGTDAGLFNLDTNTGALSFKNAPDYEAPADADGNNIYNINLTANDGSLNSAPQLLSIRVLNVDDANAAPIFTSSSKANVAENSTAVATLMATDADGDTLTYSVTGGADQALFSWTAIVVHLPSLMRQTSKLLGIVIVITLTTSKLPPMTARAALRPSADSDRHGYQRGADPNRGY